MKHKCKMTLERAYLFLDGELLSEAERREIRVHLEECAPCYERVGLEKEVSQLIARLKGCSPCPPALKNRITDQLQM